MINNLQLELKRRELEQEFLEIQLYNDSQQTNRVLKGDGELSVIETPSSVGTNSSQNFVESLRGVNMLTGKSSSEDTSLTLQDTEDANIKQGIKSNGVKYSVRTNRKRFFFPNEWKKFWDALETKKQRRTLDILINTGARIKEASHIRKRDIDFERGTLTIEVAKIKAKKGEKFPDPRTFKLSSQFLERIKDYTKDLKDDDYIPVLTDSALNLAMKKILERIGIKDFKMFSVHNVRKTHGNWLVAHEVSMAKVCKRLGHTAEVFLKNYASADIFNDKDREEIKEILGDLINGS